MTRVLRSYATQNEAKNDLKNYVTPKQLGSLNQALTDAFDRAGKDSGNHEVEHYGMRNIRHASAGDQGKDNSVTLFYFHADGEVRLIALAKHETNGYRIDDDLGQDDRPFKRGKLVGPSGG